MISSESDFYERELERRKAEDPAFASEFDWQLQEIQGRDRVDRRARELWADEVADEWLRSPNAYLGGATPLAVLERQGAQPVLDAIDAALSGAYA